MMHIARWSFVLIIHFNTFCQCWCNHRCGDPPKNLVLYICWNGRFWWIWQENLTYKWVKRRINKKFTTGLVVIFHSLYKNFRLTFFLSFLHSSNWGIYIYIYIRKTKPGHIKISIYFHPAMGIDTNQLHQI